ncbi:MAG: glutamate synthase subunit beta [Actinobacteria bacterium]|nr:glutamate synthase subunit beta [Actinomycetota bacterium]MCL5445246.1 glutamate synthase subunit beta [Actinomycetota bacterium]
MGKPTGFLEYSRALPRRRPVRVRLRDWREVYEPFPPEESRHQGARCMDCGIPFCHECCPLGNLIPEWNDLVYRDDWYAAMERLHATNNFPEFTGRLCPAPCEAGCVLGINSDPVTIERIEYEIAERAWKERWINPLKPREQTTKRVAIVGSGPAGLACAQQLARAGHSVTVYERAERPGGLLRYGIPEFKMEKAVLDRRLAQLRAEGVVFSCSTSVSAPSGERGVSLSCAREVKVVPAGELVDRFDAVVVAGGSTLPRDLDIPGRSLKGIYFALEYLKPSNMVREGTLQEAPVSAKGKHVVIIGGGDTGADCLGTAHRQGALSVHQLEIMPQPPESRPEDNPWPVWPVILRTSSAHEEGGKRLFSVTTTEFAGEDNVTSLRGQQVEVTVEAGRPSFQPVEGGGFELPCDLVLIAMGFTGAERNGVVSELSLDVAPNGSVVVDESWMTTRDGVFACGDIARGQSLVVWAIAEGRSAAASVDRYLMGESDLPAPIRPGQLAIR